MNLNYDWIEFYSSFANKLLEYKKDRKTLLEKLQNVFKSLELKFPKLEADNSISDIDPFSIFGMFNKNLKNENRTLIIKELSKEFCVNNIRIPTKFDGVPLLNNLKANFFSWTRQINDIDNLWELFQTALQYADAKDKTQIKNKFIESYNIVIKQSCIKWNITIGLFWIRPYYFIDLDKKMRDYIKDYCPEIVENKTELFDSVPDGESYLWLSETISKKLSKNELEYKNIPDLSYMAYIEPKQKNIDDDKKVVHYWMYSAGPNSEKWDDFYKKGIMAIAWGEMGDLSKYENKNQMKDKMKKLYGQDRQYRNDAHATWQFVNEMKIGDVVFVKRGMHELIGCGIVESDYIYDDLEKSNYKSIRKVRWEFKGSLTHADNAVVKTLTDITQYTGYVEKLKTLFENQGNEMLDKEIEYSDYSKKDFLEDVYMSEDDYKRLCTLIKIKKNIILQGAPGVGKTFIARRLAYSLIGKQDAERVMMVQFHQSYSYEDFIMGFRPKINGGFELMNGPFYKFCKNAESDSENDYYFIIDEINRGNLSKIFGELFMLIEADKREKVKLNLLYSDEKFSVPNNVYIIGMMNTADRSLAMVDYALRRRFAFFDIKPAFESKQFIEYQRRLDNQKFDNLINTINSLNNVIINDDSLGEGFQIGHSYFCNMKICDENILSNIIEYEIIPLIKEYWFDEPSKVREWSNLLRSSIK